MDVVRTYLEMISPEALKAPDHLPEGVTLVHRQLTPDEYRFFYREVGRDYRWTDRLAWTDAQLEAYLSKPELGIYVMSDQGHEAGFFELYREPEGSIEIKYFGLLPSAIGRGLGKHLLGAAVREAWRLGASRVWLHTCTLDHPAALANYQARGFVPFRTETYQV